VLGMSDCLVPLCQPETVSNTINHCSNVSQMPSLGLAKHLRDTPTVFNLLETLDE